MYKTNKNEGRQAFEWGLGAGVARFRRGSAPLEHLILEVRVVLS